MTISLALSHPNQESQMAAGPDLISSRHSLCRAKPRSTRALAKSVWMVRPAESWFNGPPWLATKCFKKTHAMWTGMGSMKYTQSLFPPFVQRTYKNWWPCEACKSRFRSISCIGAGDCSQRPLTASGWVGLAAKHVRSVPRELQQSLGVFFLQTFFDHNACEQFPQKIL